MPKKSERLILNFMLLIGGIILVIILFGSLNWTINQTFESLIPWLVLLIPFWLFSLYILRELIWLIFYLSKSAPYSHFATEHVGHHERILVQYLENINETPDEKLSELAEMNSQAKEN